jgi:hypothetical protein
MLAHSSIDHDTIPIIKTRVVVPLFRYNAAKVLNNSPKEDNAIATNENTLTVSFLNIVLVLGLNFAKF